MAAELLRVPEVAAGATEVLLSEWTTPEGEAVSNGAVIAVIETDKATVDVESEADTVILRRLVDEGATVEVGSPMAVLGSPADLGDVDAFLAGIGVQVAAVPEAVAVPETAPAPDPAPIPHAPPIAEPAAPGSAASSNGRIFVSPIARKLLREADISPDEVAGTGPGGRIVRRDVDKKIADVAQAAAEAPAAPAPVAARGVAPASTSTPVGYTDTPHSRIRRTIATRLTQSTQNTPHFYVKRSARLDALLALRKQVNDAGTVRISVNDFIIKAVAAAHTRVPEANVIWTDDAIRQYHSVDISVAIASDRGLVTPVVRSVENASLSSIATSVRTYADQADAGKLRQSDLEGGTISISNLGMFGVEEFSAIINPPQSSILAVGAARPTAVVDDGDISVANVVNLVLSVDHRAIDGALAARWMNALVTALENPFGLLV
jgi:pyruvate dehydrogenase E2 component (dihydrolipoamide acetyltransferase)